MANISLGFNLSASAVGMSQGINAGVVELQKLGYAAKQTARDVSTLKTIEISRAFISGVSGIVSAFERAQQALKSFVDESVGIGEEASKSTVIFGQAASKAVSEFADSASSIGLSRLAALQATASFGNLFTAIGLTQDQAVSMSLQITRLAADLASFNNTTTEDAILALGAALRGEAEPIRRYGVLLNEASLKQAAFSSGLINSTKGNLTPAVKAQAAFAAILQQTSKAQGDFLRTSESLANQQRILGAEFANIRATVGDALQPAYKAFVAALRESLPQVRDVGIEIANFIAGIDFGATIQAAIAAFGGFANAISRVLVVAAPLASRLLPSIGSYLAFINRQAISSGIAGIAKFFTTAASAAISYRNGALAAATATAALSASIRSFLASTGVGLLIVIFGAAAGAVIDWATSAKDAAELIASTGEEAAAVPKQAGKAFEQAAEQAARFGEEAKEALKIPQLTVADFAEQSLKDATNAVEKLAEQLGGLDKVPQVISASFVSLQSDVRDANESVLNSGGALKIAIESARALTAQVKLLTDAEEERVRKTKEAGEAAARAAKEAQDRTRELAAKSLPAAEQSRLKLQEDLLAISRELTSAQQDFYKAQRSGDVAAIRAASERLRLAKLAQDGAVKEDRLRRLEARGIDAKLLRPARTIRDDFQDIRAAFNAKELNGDQLIQAAKNLAEEGIKIRADILKELSKPSQRALQVSDVRTSEGISQFFAAGRQDPAIEQRREQLKKLDEIRRAIIDAGLRPVDILGA